MDTETGFENKNRREFIRGTLGVAAVGICGTFLSSLLQACEKDWVVPLKVWGKTIDINLNEDTQIANLNWKNPPEKGGCYVLRTFPEVNYGIPVIIIKMPDNTFTCFSALCTHDSCFGNKLWVQPRILNIACECHGSEYEARNHGKVAKGPAEKAIREFNTIYNPETKILSIEF